MRRHRLRSRTPASSRQKHHGGRTSRWTNPQIMSPRRNRRSGRHSPLACMAFPARKIPENPRKSTSGREMRRRPTTVAQGLDVSSAPEPRPRPQRGSALDAHFDQERGGRSLRGLARTRHHCRFTRCYNAREPDSVTIRTRISSACMNPVRLTPRTNRGESSGVA